MFFSSPLWLIALAPWALVCLWLMRRRLPTVDVPFLKLWQTGATLATPQRGLAPPPVAIVLILASLLLLILGMSGLSLRGWGPMTAQSQTPVKILIDRGFTMSAKEGNAPRFLTTAQAAGPALAEALGARREVDLSFVPSQPPLPSDLGHWLEDLAATPPTDIPTRDMLAGEVARMARDGSDGPIIVISDQSLGSPSHGIIQIPPDQPLAFMGIARIGAQAEPQKQVLVRIHNQSDQTTAELRIVSAGYSTTKQIMLPPRGQSSDQFVDLAEMGDVVKASIESPAAVAGNATARVVRQPGRPTIETRRRLSPELERMIAIYNRREADRGSRGARAMVVDRAADLPADEPAAWVDGAAHFTLPASPALQVRPGKITAHVQWSAALRLATLASLPAGGGWTTLVSADGHPAVAIRSEPVRQVWVGFTSPEMAKSPNYVIFWTNVFDLLGGDQGGYASQRAGQVAGIWHEETARGESAPVHEPGLRAGLYRRSDGAMLAVNAPDVTAPPLPTSAWREELSHLANERVPSLNLARWMELAALAMVLTAAVLWPYMKGAGTAAPERRPPMNGKTRMRRAARA